MGAAPGAHGASSGSGGLKYGDPASNLYFSTLSDLPKTPLERFLTQITNPASKSTSEQRKRDKKVKCVFFTPELQHIFQAALITSGML